MDNSESILHVSTKPEQPKVSNNNEALYDDLYNFDDMAFDENLEIKRPFTMNGVNTDEDTDDDINLDYEYGFDYDKIIKDRLKAANEAFNNDQTPLVKNNTKISFDNTVSAIDEQQKQQQQQQQQQQEEQQRNNSNKRIQIMDNSNERVANMAIEEETPSSQHEQEQDENNGHKEVNILKIPLNDTIVKDEPDRFHNKLKEIVARYDVETQPDIIEHLQGKNDDLIFTKFKPLKSHDHHEGNNDNDKINVNTSSADIEHERERERPSSSLQQHNEEFIDEIIDDDDDDGAVDNRPKTPLINEPVEEEEEKQQPEQLTTTSTSANRVLIEREGKFLYVDSDEYLATTMAAEKNKSDNNNNNNNVNTHIHNSSSNNNNSNENQTKINAINKNKAKISLNFSIPRRDSHSADVGAGGQRRQLSKTRIESNRTPDYGINYQSPYAVSPRKVNSNMSNSKKDQEEIDMKQRLYMNEVSFKSWLDKKEKQKREELLRREKEKHEKTNSAQQSTVEESVITFEKWLNNKRQQLAKEKEYQNKLKELVLSDEKPRPTREEQKAAYNDWLRRKIVVKHEMKTNEKIEKKKWAARYRRSRKYQRLTQAIELAQAYGYTNYYYTPGFSV